MPLPPSEPIPKPAPSQDRQIVLSNERPSVKWSGKTVKKSSSPKLLKSATQQNPEFKKKSIFIRVIKRIKLFLVKKTTRLAKRILFNLQYLYLLNQGWSNKEIMETKEALRVLDLNTSNMKANSMGTIRKQWRKMMLKNHPDKQQQLGTANQNSDDLFLKANNAYKKLLEIQDLYHIFKEK